MITNTQEFEGLLEDMARQDQVVANMAAWLADRLNTLGVEKPVGDANG